MTSMTRTIISRARARIRVVRRQVRKMCCEEVIGVRARRSCRSAVRMSEEPGFSDACFARDAIGFRCVRKAPSGATVSVVNK